MCDKMKYSSWQQLSVLIPFTVYRWAKIGATNVQRSCILLWKNIALFYCCFSFFVLFQFFRTCASIFSLVLLIQWRL